MNYNTIRKNRINRIQGQKRNQTGNTTKIKINDAFQMKPNNQLRFKNIGIKISDEIYNNPEFNLDKISFKFEKFRQLITICTQLKLINNKEQIEILIKLNKINIYFDKLQKIKNLGIEITVYNIEKLNSLELDFDKLQKIKNLGIEITLNEIERLNKLKLDFDKLQKIKNLGIEITLNNIGFLSNLELDFKILNKLKEEGYEMNLEALYGYIDLKITEEEILICKKYGIKKLNEVIFFVSLIRNQNENVIKNYLLRKNEYLTKNEQTLPDDKFNELFGGTGTYGKPDIYQNGPICYAHTGFELLKKTNGFDEIIKTNVKETTEGWKVRLPFCDKNGIRIKIRKDEIDKEYSIQRENGNKKTFILNSKSRYLGFKILEIAYIKKRILKEIIMNRCRNKTLEKIYIEYLKNGELEINNELLELINMGSNEEKMLHEILPKNFLIGGGKIIKLNEKIKELALINLPIGQYYIVFSIDKHKRIKTKIIDKRKEKNYVLKAYKMNNKNGAIKMSNFEIRKPKLIIKDGKLYVLILPRHSYSIEKCYTDEDTGEKRVRIVNPHHTGIKYDISLDECIKNFNLRIIGINIDEMFR